MEKHEAFMFETSRMWQRQIQKKKSSLLKPHVSNQFCCSIFTYSEITGAFLSAIIFLAATGNILVCVAIYTERSLRRIGNLFLASLAIADLFMSLLVMTFASVNDILGESEIPLKISEYST